MTERKPVVTRKAGTKTEPKPAAPKPTEPATPTEEKGGDA